MEGGVCLGQPVGMTGLAPATPVTDPSLSARWILAIMGRILWNLLRRRSVMPDWTRDRQLIQDIHERCSGLSVPSILVDLACLSRGASASPGSSSRSASPRTRPSSATVGRRLADMKLKPWREKRWCIPTVNAEYVRRKTSSSRGADARWSSFARVKIVVIQRSKNLVCVPR